MSTAVVAWVRPAIDPVAWEAKPGLRSPASMGTKVSPVETGFRRFSRRSRVPRSTDRLLVIQA